ncbi:MAG: polymer-forming cytoskeletal protein [Lachnospiraceae bacterium]|nr:polymer-forming cytoskeletal protein [Lachnospiraceae bacterium]
MLGKKTTEQTNAKISSIIGADMVVSGGIKAKEGIRVEGSVTGDVETDGALIISASGKVKGNVRGSSIFIGGSLEGDLTSGGRTEVVSTGRVIGDIRTKSLVVDENAVFQGQCTMNVESISTSSQNSFERAEDKKEDKEDDSRQVTIANSKWNKRQ